MKSESGFSFAIASQPLKENLKFFSLHSIAHPLSLNGLAPWGSKRVCRASPYSPSTPGNVPFRFNVDFCFSPIFIFLMRGGAMNNDNL